MLLGEVLRVALQSIRANLFRACLTMLGIVWGITLGYIVRFGGLTRPEFTMPMGLALGCVALFFFSEGLVEMLRGIGRS